MKISDVKTYIVPEDVSVTPWVNGDPWVLVQVMTDTGISGWGHAHTLYEREEAIARKVHDLAQRMDGMDPFRIKHFMMRAGEGTNGAPIGIETAAAAAGIEIALWDIVGKALDAPVHQLLGGRCRDRIALYANCWSNVVRSPDELASFATVQVERGFRAVKIYPFLYNVGTAHGIACIRAVREAVGADVDVFVDMLEDMPSEAPNLIFDALGANGVTWLEDPAPSSDIAGLSRIRRQSAALIVSGEDVFAKDGFARLCAAGAADILNPEVALLGILGMKEVAAIAEAYDLQIAVHNANTMTIGFAAAVQAAASIPNTKWVEYFPTLEAGSNSFSRFPFELDETGSIAIPRSPGLGVTVDEPALRAMEYFPSLDG